MKQNTVDLWNIFNKKMDAAGYTVSVTQDIPGMPDGSTCFINKDKWIPIIKSCIYLRSSGANSLVEKYYSGC